MEFVLEQGQNAVSAYIQPLTAQQVRSTFADPSMAFYGCTKGDYIKSGQRDDKSKFESSSFSHS